MNKEVNMNEYPIIQEWIEKGYVEYIKRLKQSVSKQLDTRRYYKMKYSGKFEPYITEHDILNEIELILQVAPSIFNFNIDNLVKTDGTNTNTL